jgi:hypothetical protein
VLVVDRGGHGTVTISTHALMRGAVMKVHRWGLLPRVIATGTPAMRTTFFRYESDPVRLDIRPGHGVDSSPAQRLLAAPPHSANTPHCATGCRCRCSPPQTRSLPSPGSSILSAAITRR